MILLGFLHRGGLEQWSYAIAAETVVHGGEFMRFTSDDVDFSTRTIDAEIWEEGKWVKRRTHFPEAIRNFELNKNADRILDTVPYSLGGVVKKDDQSHLFSRTPSTAKYMPETLSLEPGTPVIEKILEWGAGILKPSRGRLGQGIIFIKTNGRKFDFNDDGNVSTVTKKELKQLLKPYFSPDARDYILQQFAAGTGPSGRFFNVRVIVTKSGDGNWHACSGLMSLLAKSGSIIANRDVGAKNIDLDAFLIHRYGKGVETIYDDLFSAAVTITRVLDDSANGTAEEIALDMAIDDNGRIWIHEANWRGGLWLFDDDIGLSRHGGANLHRIGLQSRSGNDLDRANAVEIAVKAREAITKEMLNQNSMGATDTQPHRLSVPYPTLFHGKAVPPWNPHHNSSMNEGVTFGIEISRRTDETAALVAEAISSGVPALSVSSATSFRAAQRRTRLGIEAITEQAPVAPLPWLISKGGACIHDPEDERPYQKWLDEELLATGLINAEEMECGFSASPAFLRETIKNNCRDLNQKSLDLFIIEGLEKSLAHRENSEESWLNAAREMQRAVKQGQISGWGFAVSVASLKKGSPCNPQKLLTLLKKAKIPAPTALLVEITNDVNPDKIKALLKQAGKLPLQTIFSLPELPPGKKEWNQPHQCVPRDLLQEVVKQAGKGQIVLCPVANKRDIAETLQLISRKTSGSHWFHFRKNNKSNPISMKEKRVPKEQQQFRRRMEALAALAKFDHRQFFRFFVDGRFHNKYRGWTGYEANEVGSVPALLNAYCHIFDNFDLSGGLKSTHIRMLHALCMKNVLTSNPKSAPGDLRFLEAGQNVVLNISTKESLQEILDSRRGDGTALFHTRGFERTADEFTADGILETLKEKKKLKFRFWYPNLTMEQKDAMNDPGDLDAFYEVKHFIQRSFAARTDEIVHRYNEEIKAAGNDDEALLAISRVVRDLELLHPFPDGNGRALVALLMNHLLLFNGFLPAILRDPNIDAEISVKEFAEEIRGGIENTKLLLKNPEAVLYDYSIRESSEKDIKEFETLAKDLITRISPYADLNLEAANFEPHSFRASTIYLTPQRLEQVTKGNWMNANANTLSQMRFQSVQIDEVESDGQLFFFRNLGDWLKGKKNDPLEQIRKIAKKGVTAVVVDDISLARSSTLPALYVDDVDDALARAARAAKEEINCKAIAVLGAVGKTEAKESLHHILKNQAQVHAMTGDDNKTAHIMTSLANLRLTDNLEINEVAAAARPNPVSYRCRRVLPDICLFTNFSPVYIKDTETFEDVLKAHAAAVDGLQEGGLCLINSETKDHGELIDAILDRREVAIQTYGTSDGDLARVLKAEYQQEEMAWKVKADILGKAVHYSVKGFQSYLPVASAGMLLAVANLGYSVEDAALQLASIPPVKTTGELRHVKTKKRQFQIYDHSQRSGLPEVTSALQDLQHLPFTGKLIAVIGDLTAAKSNQWVQQQHEELGSLLDNSPIITHLFTVGNHIERTNASRTRPLPFHQHAESISDIESPLPSHIENGDIVLLIGHPASRLQDMLNKLK